MNRCCKVCTRSIAFEETLNKRIVTIGVLYFFASHDELARIGFIVFGVSNRKNRGHSLRAHQRSKSGLNSADVVIIIALSVIVEDIEANILP